MPSTIYSFRSKGCSILIEQQYYTSSTYFLRCRQQKANLNDSSSGASLQTNNKATAVLIIKRQVFLSSMRIAEHVLMAREKIPKLNTDLIDPL